VREIRKSISLVEYNIIDIVNIELERMIKFLISLTNPCEK